MQTALSATGAAYTKPATHITLSPCAWLQRHSDWRLNLSSLHWVDTDRPKLGRVIAMPEFPRAHPGLDYVTQIPGVAKGEADLAWPWAGRMMALGEEWCGG